MYRQYSILLHVVLIFNEYYKTLARSTERKIINPPVKWALAYAEEAAKRCPGSLVISAKVLLWTTFVWGQSFKRPYFERLLGRLSHSWKEAEGAKVIFLTELQCLVVCSSVSLSSFQMKRSLRTGSHPPSLDFGSDAPFDKTPCFQCPWLASGQGQRVLMIPGLPWRSHFLSSYKQWCFCIPRSCKHVSVNEITLHILVVPRNVFLTRARPEKILVRWNSFISF